jgi:predicted Zn-dependent peptidase
MLQVRENTFLQFPLSKNGLKAGWEWESEYFRVFQNAEKLLVVMYHPYEIETFKKWFEFFREKESVFENSNAEAHKEIVVYIFSMWWEIFEEELAHLSDRIRIETIPDEVLETYKKIFGF